MEAEKSLDVMPVITSHEIRQSTSDEHEASELACTCSYARHCWILLGLEGARSVSLKKAKLTGGVAALVSCPCAHIAATVACVARALCDCNKLREAAFVGCEGCPPGHGFVSFYQRHQAPVKLRNNSSAVIENRTM